MIAILQAGGYLTWAAAPIFCKNSPIRGAPPNCVTKIPIITIATAAPNTPAKPLVKPVLKFSQNSLAGLFKSSFIAFRPVESSTLLVLSVEVVVFFGI